MAHGKTNGKPATNDRPVTNGKPLSPRPPDSVRLIEEQGIRTSRDASNVLVAIAKDVGRQSMTPQVGNTMCNALGKMIRVKELEIKYGIKNDAGVQRLELAD